jgi:hypothetical protein
MLPLNVLVFAVILSLSHGFQVLRGGLTRPAFRKALQSVADNHHCGLKVDLTGKTVFVAGVADSTGYGWAIAKACAEAGARILLGTWPPVLPIFEPSLKMGKFDEDLELSNGRKMEIAKVY